MGKTTRRLRVFAGPNGSGKSTIINKIRNTTVSGQPIDFGVYINADDIAQKLINGGVQFQEYDVVFTPEEFAETAHNSGLLQAELDIDTFRKCFSFSNNSVVLDLPEHVERLAQIIAHALREKLLLSNKKFSFETVFSHDSKVVFLERARALGYKVYLYFVSTENPEINIYRVERRVRDGGHGVPVKKIRSRYDRAMKLCFPASRHAYQAYFFDNSGEPDHQNMFAHFKVNREGEQVWDQFDPEDLPDWFKKYYISQM